eukprot:365366-Chlamydomonas_euryale.AAC.2
MRCRLGAARGHKPSRRYGAHLCNRTSLYAQERACPIWRESWQQAFPTSGTRGPTGAPQVMLDL